MVTPCCGGSQSPATASPGAMDGTDDQTTAAPYPAGHASVCSTTDGVTSATAKDAWGTGPGARGPRQNHVRSARTARGTNRRPPADVAAYRPERRARAPGMTGDAKASFPAKRAASCGENRWPGVHHCRRSWRRSSRRRAVIDAVCWTKSTTTPSTTTTDAGEPSAASFLRLTGQPRSASTRRKRASALRTSASEPTMMKSSRYGATKTPVARSTTSATALECRDSQCGPDATPNGRATFSNVRPCHLCRTRHRSRRASGRFRNARDRSTLAPTTGMPGRTADKYVARRITSATETRCRGAIVSKRRTDALGERAPADASEMTRMSSLSCFSTAPTGTTQSGAEVDASRARNGTTSVTSLRPPATTSAVNQSSTFAAVSVAERWLGSTARRGPSKSPSATPNRMDATSSGPCGWSANVRAAAATLNGEWWCTGAKAGVSSAEKVSKSS